MDTTQLLIITFVIGITAEAITAALSAARMRMDWFGVISLGGLTALGGGTVRDVVLGNYPLTWVENPIYLVIVVVAALITAELAFLMAYFRRLFLVCDAIGLATFSVIGTQIALELGHGFVIAAVAATLTGVTGGVLRDILSDRVPLVFTQDVYAAVSIFTTAVYMFQLWIGVDENITIVVSLILAFTVRMIAIKRQSNFKQFSYDENAPADPRLKLSTEFIQKGFQRFRRPKRDKG